MTRAFLPMREVDPTRLYTLHMYESDGSPEGFCKHCDYDPDDKTVHAKREQEGGPEGPPSNTSPRA